ncbi:MAG: DUF2996 domain-containing protein [Drouetiella hepatica Uher 2000/2452]|jgi:hypothetical protein|uniref:DUF2996 domain-containing protein n=1 Tax=Drouetiella hepatica Uher 2000/2452 TaxID=904376 RepID=A0A951QD48_9CYAN|nr:DUF2996 domain-containing protein [Drouetiella hepatica Uher 2000/2452]
MSDETTPQTPATEPEEKPAKAPEAQAEGAEKSARAPKASDGEGAPAKPPKKEKAPALEDKPFAEFIQQDYLPGLKLMLSKLGIQDLELKFEKQKLPIAGMDEPYWQTIGRWQDGKRQFHIIFSKEDIQAPKFFCYADNGAQPSVLESFMIDERKTSLDLLMLNTAQRLNGQKWLVRN